MDAVYYAIFEFNEVTHQRGSIVEEGIVPDSEHTIYPRQTTGIEDLPFECELHHFSAKSYRVETCRFEITRENLMKYRNSEFQTSS